jgi:hypothetical protein
VLLLDRRETWSNSAIVTSALVAAAFAYSSLRAEMKKKTFFPVGRKKT